MRERGVCVLGKERKMGTAPSSITYPEEREKEEKFEWLGRLINF